MAKIDCAIMPRKPEPRTRQEIQDEVRRELRIRELEQKRKAGTLSKLETAELAARKVSRFLNNDTFTKS